MADDTPDNSSGIPGPRAITSTRADSNELDARIRKLPPYARSLLKVRVPVRVTLASTKQPLGEILAMGPGSIIQFNKSCDARLALEVGSRQIAEGEAVKVGEKFGLWITGMTMPAERFHAISGIRPMVHAATHSMPSTGQP